MSISEKDQKDFEKFFRENKSRFQKDYSEQIKEELSSDRYESDIDNMPQGVYHKWVADFYISLVEAYLGEMGIEHSGSDVSELAFHIMNKEGGGIGHYHGHPDKSYFRSSKEETDKNDLMRKVCEEIKESCKNDLKKLGIEVNFVKTGSSINSKTSQTRCEVNLSDIVVDGEKIFYASVSTDGKEILVRIFKTLEDNNNNKCTTVDLGGVWKPENLVKAFRDSLKK